jgi:hypothetical protein
MADTKDALNGRLSYTACSPRPTGCNMIGAYNPDVQRVSQRGLMENTADKLQKRGRAAAKRASRKAKRIRSEAASQDRGASGRTSHSIAAASVALLHAAIKVLTPSRN